MSNPSVYRTVHLDSTEVDLLTRSGSVADPMAKNLLTTLGKPSSINVQKPIRLTFKVPPLKREQCTWKMELSLIISRTVIIRVKRSSKYSDISMVHREDGAGRPPRATA
jgi:hypothetical protein